MQNKRTPARTMLFFVVPIVLLIVAALVVYYFVTQAGRAPASAALQAAQLGNGLKVIVYEDPSAAIVSVNVWYRVGSRHEIVGKRGLAHLMEHMMFKGSTNVEPEDHARQIDQVGGISNAFTREDVTGYFQTLPSDWLELALRLEAERMKNLIITDEKLKAEREVVKEEHRLRLQNQPIGIVLSKFREIAFKETSYAWTAAGATEDLDTVTATDLQNFYKQYYAPNNAILIVAGDVQFNTVMELARKHFGGLSKNENLPPLIPITLAAQSAIQEETITMPVQLPIILGGYRLPEAKHADLPALEVAGTILSTGGSSRLRQNLVNDQKIAIQAAGIPLIYRDVGVFIAAAFYTDDKNPAAVKEALLSEIERLKNEPISEIELQKAKNQLTAGQVFAQDPLSGVAQAIGQAEIFYDDYREFSKASNRYLSVTAEQIRAVAQKYFNRENLTIVTLNPEK